MKQQLLGLDQWLNTFIYIPGDGFGWADEALSARLFRCYLQGLLSDRWYRAVDAVARLFGDRDHCYQSWLSEIERRQLPGHYRLDAI